MLEVALFHLVVSRVNGVESARVESVDSCSDLLNTLQDPRRGGPTDRSLELLEVDGR